MATRQAFFVFYQSYNNHFSSDILLGTVNGWCSSRCINMLWGHDFAMSVRKNSGCAISESLHAPGTITGSFQGSGSIDSNGRDLRLHPDDVQVVFDTMSLLCSIMKQARHVVKKDMLVGGAVVNLLVMELGKQLLMDLPIPTKDKVSVVLLSQTAGTTSKSDKSEPMADDKASNKTTPIDTSGPANNDEDLLFSYLLHLTLLPLQEWKMNRVLSSPICIPTSLSSFMWKHNQKCTQKMLHHSSLQGLCSLCEA
eukprot:15361403-Ditylum_brightwellii.AAC.1